VEWCYTAADRGARELPGVDAARREVRGMGISSQLRPPRTLFAADAGKASAFRRAITAAAAADHDELADDIGL
jgi:hypothetical protein